MKDDKKEWQTPTIVNIEYEDTYSDEVGHGSS